MIKIRNTLLVFLLIVVQSALAITVGVAALFNASLKVVPAGVYAGELSISGMSYPDAAQAIEANYTNKFKTRSLRLKVENGETYEIPFSEIDMKVDGNATVHSLKSLKGMQDISGFLNFYFGQSKPVLKPIIKFNEANSEKRCSNCLKKLMSHHPMLLSVIKMV